MSAQPNESADEWADYLLEQALYATAHYARALGDDGRAIEAWRIAHQLKALRRPEVVEKLDSERLQRARAG